MKPFEDDKFNLIMKIEYKTVQTKRRNQKDEEHRISADIFDNKYTIPIDDYKKS